MADYTFYVKVANSKFVLDSVSQATIALGHGITYRFDQSDSSNSGHPLVFSTTSDGTHNSGSAYTTGVTTTGTAGSSGAYVDIAVTSSTPASLYYYCSNHSGMGSAVITTGNTHVTTNNLGLLLPILANADDQWGSHINQSLRKIEDTFGANADVYTYNITGDTTAITGSATAGGTLAFSAGQHLEVYLNGVKLVGNLSSGNDYTVDASTNTITLASNAINGDVVNIVVFKTFQFADAVPATGGAFSGNVAYTGNIQVDDIIEKSADHGVEIDGVTLKDGGGTFTGNVDFSNTSASVLDINRQTSDGEIVSFSKDGSSVGYIGTYGGDMTVGTGDTGIRFIDSLDCVVPVSDASGTSRDNAVDLGYSSIRYKDLHLGGNVVIGTAGKGVDFSGSGTSAEILHEYEESSGTVEMYDASTGTTNDIGGGTYIMTKIGDVAHIKLSITMSSNSPSNAVYVTLPITNSTGKLVGCSGNRLFGGENTENAESISLVCASGNSRARIQTYNGANLASSTQYYNACLTMVGLT